MHTDNTDWTNFRRFSLEEDAMENTDNLISVSKKTLHFSKSRIFVSKFPNKILNNFARFSCCSIPVEENIVAIGKNGKICLKNDMEIAYKITFLKNKVEIISGLLDTMPFFYSATP